MESKGLPAFTKDIDGRAVAGIFAVHGHLDAYGDISHPGAFAKTIQERGTRKVKYLWSHTFGGYFDTPQPPTAVIKSIQEIGRDALPEGVLDVAPDATGGVEVVREYLNTDRGNEMLEGVSKGAITEQSYAFDVMKYDFADMNGRKVRNLRELKLYEVSDVLWGANDATLAAKSLPADVLVKYLERYLTELKAGARHSSADTDAINTIHQLVVDLGCTTCKGLVDGEIDSEDAKSRAAADLSPALTPTALKHRLRAAHAALALHP